MTTVNLQAGTNRWSNWKQFSLGVSMDALAANFDFTVSDKDDDGRLFGLIGAGEEVSIFFDGEEFFKGFVDGHSVTAGRNGHDVNIEGRSLSGDFADCAAIHSTRVFKNKSDIEIIREITAGFLANITVQSGFSPSLIPEFKFSLGDTVFDVIDRLGKMSGFVALPSVDGIVITRVTNERSQYQIVDIKEAFIRVDHRDLFSEYTVIGERNGFDDDDPTDAAIVKASSSDGLVKRYRPIIIQQENQATEATVKVHADWAKTRNRANAAVMECTVKGFKNINGEFFKVNERAWIRQPLLGIDQEFLISYTNFIKDASGTRTVLSLVNPSLYSIDPTVAKRNAKSSRDKSEYFDLK